MTIRFSFDTNILIYAVDITSGEKHPKAAELILGTAPIGRGYLVEQSLMEFLHACTRKTGVSFRTGVEYVETLSTFFEVLLPRQDTLRRTLEIVTRYRLSIWDARMIAVCASHECLVLFSEDMQDGGYYGDVRVINPFRPANRELVHEVLNA
jgi:predicted nucleic acid-binding protein